MDARLTAGQGMFDKKQSPESRLKASYNALRNLEPSAAPLSDTSLTLYWWSPAHSSIARKNAVRRRRARPPLLIEVIGLPGSGKTTLITMSGFTRTGRPIDTALQPGSRSAFALLRAPLFAALVFLSALLRGIYAPCMLRKCVTSVRRYVEVCDVRGAGTAVIDEGPTHALFTLFFGSTPNFLSKILERHLLGRIAKRVDYFVHIDVHPSECVARIRRRAAPHSRFNACAPPPLLDGLMRDCTYSSIVGALKELSGENFDSCSDLVSGRALLRALSTEHSYFEPQETTCNLGGDA